MEKGYLDRFNGKLCDELLNRELFAPVLEMQVLVERWWQHSNQVRPDWGLGRGHPLLKLSRPNRVIR